MILNHNIYIYIYHIFMYIPCLSLLEFPFATSALAGLRWAGLDLCGACVTRADAIWGTEVHINGHQKNKWAIYDYL